ncbi:DUF6911 family protein [Gallaecimonas kandeliae]|uniref:DUF6911 family protein n=1 Tax=Gallaecimonas kandeliae TaxID=3029055 RepID=UPI003AF31D94
MSGNSNFSDDNTGPILELCYRDKTYPPPAITIEGPVWESMESAIRDVFGNGGFVRVSVITPRASFIRQLSMKALPEKCTLVALTRATDPKSELLEWWESGDEPYRGNILFGDDEWDARMVCTKVEVILSLFKELFEHGDLHEGLLQMRSQWDPKP